MLTNGINAIDKLGFSELLSIVNLYKISFYEEENMAQSLNTKVDLTMKATSYMGLATYGKIMIGDKSFEFYNDRNVEDNIQIPWEEIEYIAASVIFGKHINRFVIFTKNNGKYSFSAKDNKTLLRGVNKYIKSDKMVKSKSVLQIMGRGIKSIFRK